MGLMNSHEFKNHKPGSRVRHATDTGPGLCKQEFREEVDINVIVARCLKSGMMPDMRAVQPVFADVSDIGCYADVLRRVSAAEEAFLSLPAHLRSRFHNRASELVEFVQDDRNRDEAVKLGLVAALPPDPPKEVPSKTDCK